MDSQVQSQGRLLDIVDNEWKEDKLPSDDISVPQNELPDPDSDNGDSHLTLREQESKWTDLALSQLSENHN